MRSDPRNILLDRDAFPSDRNGTVSQRGLQKDTLQLGAMHAQRNSAGPLAKLSEIERGERSAGRRYRLHPFDEPALGQDGLLKPEATQRRHGVGPKRQPSADLCDLRRPFEDGDLHTDTRESNGGAEAADAGSDHQGASGAVHGGVFRHTDLVQLCSRNGVNRWVV